jgi:hypothetical protein
MRKLVEGTSAERNLVLEQDSMERLEKFEVSR